MAADHPSLLMRAMQIENAISPHEADDPDLEKRLPRIASSHIPGTVDIPTDPLIVVGKPKWFYYLLFF